MAHNLAVIDEIIDVFVYGFDVSRNSLALAMADVIVTESQNVGFGQSFSNRMIISCEKQCKVESKVEIVCDEMSETG
jgi:hypothetical protein